MKRMDGRTLVYHNTSHLKDGRIKMNRSIGSERLLFNENSAIFHLYHGENRLIFN